MTVTHLHTFLVTAVVFFIAGAYLYPKIRAYFLGIPSNVTAGLATVEKDLAAKVKAAEADVISKFHVTLGVATAAPTPVAPVAVPAAPAAPSAAAPAV